jgi:hypothetical protein
MRRMSGIPYALFLVSAVFLAVLVLTSGCTGNAPPQASSSMAPVSEDPGSGTSWKEIAIPDLQGRGNFSVSGFVGKTVIVPVVSVSCPECIVQLQRQLVEITRLEKGSPGRITIVSLDVDPDIGPGFMAAYGDPANFTGYSARSPPEMTLALLHRFGPFAIDTETIPVLLVCPDGHDLLLPAGIKTAESLNETIAREC